MRFGKRAICFLPRKEHSRNASFIPGGQEGTFRFRRSRVESQILSESLLSEPAAQLAFGTSGIARLRHFKQNCLKSRGNQPCFLCHNSPRPPPTHTPCVHQCPQDLPAPRSRWIPFSPDFAERAEASCLLFNHESTVLAYTLFQDTLSARKIYCMWGNQEVVKSKQTQRNSRLNNSWLPLTQQTVLCFPANVAYYSKKLKPCEVTLEAAGRLAFLTNSRKRDT